MPKFRYICSKCEEEYIQYQSPKVESIMCTCGNIANRQFPGSGSQVVREVIDTFTNVRSAPDEKEQNKTRKTDYFWSVEVPRLIQHYSLQTCLEEGWLVYNDKQELVIGKPPSQR